MAESKSLDSTQAPLITGGIELLGQCFHIFSKKWKKLMWLLFVIPLIMAGLSFFVGIFFAVLTSLIVATKIALTWKIVLGVISCALGMSGVLLAVFISIISNISAIYVIDGDIEVNEALKKAMPMFWKYLGWMILMGIMVGIGYLLFIVPGIILMIMFSFSLYALILENSGPVGALKRSKELVKGFWWTVLARFILVGVFAIVLSMISSFVNSMGTSLLELGAKNPAVMVFAVVVSAIAFVLSITVNFIVGSITMIYAYLIYGKLKEQKNLDSSAHDNMSVAKKVGLGILLAIGIFMFILIIFALIALASLSSIG